MKTQLLLCFILISVSSFSQVNDRFRERIKTQRIAYITNQLNLSPDEAQKFWPIYNQFTNEFEETKNSMNKLRRSTQDKLNNMSESEIEKALADELDNQQKLIDLQRKYQKQLKAAIPAKKIALLYKAERDFKIELLRKMRDRGRGNFPEDDF